MENCSLLGMMAALNRDSPSKTAPAATTSRGEAASLSKQRPEPSDENMNFMLLGASVSSSLSFFHVVILNPNYRSWFEEHLT